jgi:hypothetical protein
MQYMCCVCRPEQCVGIHHPDVIASPACYRHCFDFLGRSAGLLSIAKIPPPSLICGKSCGFMTEVGILEVSMVFQANTLSGY